MYSEEYVQIYSSRVILKDKFKCLRMTTLQFLARYNPEHSIECALSSAIKAAVQHNKFYIGDAPRPEIRAFWRRQLLALQPAYLQQRTVAQYEGDFISLRTQLNDGFPGQVDCRISHAQKSLGVFLKHLWCMRLVDVPPLCPVDAIILKKAGAVYPVTNWGYVDTIDEHRAKVEILIEAKNRFAPHLSLAEWELFAFNGSENA
jgi:hypothetical protein